MNTKSDIVRGQSRSQVFDPLDQWSENESSGSIHLEITKGNNPILGIRFTALSLSDRWLRGTELWERDW